MRFLISHVNYPSQFRRLVPAWLDEGHEVVFLAKQQEWHAKFHPNLRIISCQTTRDTVGSLQHPYLRRFEQAVLTGQSFFRAAKELRDQGWYPDYVISHLGFGNGFYLKDCFPKAVRIGLAEWFYNSVNSDVDFLPPHQISDNHLLSLRTWNAELLLELSTLDDVVVPTFWQKQQFPLFVRDHLHVIHEGVDTSSLEYLKSSNLPKPKCLPDDPDIEILTYVSRCFEQYRGFPQAIQAISKLQELRPKLHVLIVGSDCTAYGTVRSDGLTWRQWADKYVCLDPKRTHWLGSLQESDYHNVLACSHVHYYLTVPFILSWSLLEAMSAGCAIVSSTTPPVLEVLENQYSALLVDFFDVGSQVLALNTLFNDRVLAERLANEAQRQARFYCFRNGFSSWNHLLCSAVSSNC